MTKQELIALATQTAEKLKVIERALHFAYFGDAEHGSFTRVGEFVPSVFLVFKELRQLVEALQTALAQSENRIKEILENLADIRELFQETDKKYHAMREQRDELQKRIDKIGTDV